MKRLAAIVMLGMGLAMGAGCDDLEDISLGFDSFGGPAYSTYPPSYGYAVDEYYYEETYYEDSWSFFPW